MPFDNSTASRPLKISRVDAIPVALPLKKPMLMAGVRIEVAENVLVRIEAADGTVGWGESTAAPTMTGDTHESLVGAIRRYLGPILVGEDAVIHAHLVRRCIQAMHGNTGAKSAVDMALLDLVGRHLGVGVVELLGGAMRDEVVPMWLLGNPSVEEDIEEAKAKQAEGFKFFKLKVGVKPIDDEIESARALRNALGRNTLLCADANMGLEFAQAQQLLQKVREVDLLYFEQPVRSEDLSAMQALTALGAIPICADEGIAGSAEVLAHANAKALNGINLKLMKAGGPRAALRVAAVCEALGLSITVAGKIAESSISAAHTLAVACAAPNVEWGVNLTNLYLVEDLVRRPIVVRDGRVFCTRGPGNGLEVDESAVARYQVTGTFGH